MRMTIAQAKDFLGSVLTLDSNNAVELTLHNSDVIEKRISFDKRYGNDPAYQKFQNLGGQVVKISKKKDWAELIWEIKKSNRIQYVKPEYADVLADFILSQKDGVSGFYSSLIQPKPTMVNDMVADLSNKTGASHQLSWCSKIVKYLECWEGSQGELNYQNKYSIYDKFLSIVLPYYFKIFGVSMPNGEKWTPNKLTNKEMWDNYDEYDAAIAHLLGQLKLQKGVVLSKHRLDHLLWYYYRNYDSNLLTKAVNALIK